MPSDNMLLKKMPPLRPPGAEAADKDPDGQDALRREYAIALWHSQAWALHARDAQIEENVRMLAGQQWRFRVDLLNKSVDISEYLTDEERIWRQRPVINRLLFWFMLHHARATENPPIIAFQPDTLDKFDADLAEVMDTVYKTVWHEVEMLDVIDRALAWLIPGGISYIKTRIDPNKGPLRDWIRPTVLEGPNGPVIIPAAPFNAKGEPLVQIHGDGTYSQTGEPHRERAGDLDVDVLSPLEVRSEWGPKPFHKKRWHEYYSLLTPEEVYDSYGVEVEPDTSGEDIEGHDELRRLLFGAGFFGAAGNNPRAQTGDPTGRRGFVRIRELWHKPSRIHPEMEETDESPGGRLMLVAGEKVIYDGPRPAFFKGASPGQQLEFVRLPGRPHASTPQEMLNPIQRAYNRGAAQILEHRNLTCNPVGILDDRSGVSSKQITNRPGLILTVMAQAGVEPFKYVQPPRLGEDVYLVQKMLADELNFLGQTEGTRGEAPTRDASGELVKELRFNTDRFLGPTMRRVVLSLGRVVDDWIALIPLVWDQEKVVRYAGDDQVARTVTVYPEMFRRGKVHVRADIESMLPEGRGERQQRVMFLWSNGAYGPPGSPEANRKLFDLAKFPHTGRIHRPGGIDRVMAEQENGRLVLGTPAAELPIYEWQGHEEHVLVHEEYMKSPEYQRLSIPMQVQFVEHRAYHIMWIQFLQAQQLEQMLQMQAAAAVAESAGDVPAEGGGGGSTNGKAPASSQSALPARAKLPRSAAR